MAESWKAEKPSVPVDFYWRIHSVEGEKDEKGRFFEGYCSTDDIDLAGERVTQECMAKVVAALPGIGVLFNHDIDCPIGKILTALVDERGLYVKGLISETEDKLWTKVKEGIISKMSIRLRNRQGRAVRDNGREVYEITDMEVPELSLTALPCCLGASVAVAYEKTRTFKEEDVMGNINVDKILEVMKEAVKDVAAQNSVEELKSSAFESLKGYISGVEDKSTITDDILKGKIVEALSSQTIEEDQKSTIEADLLSLAKDHLKAEYGYPAPDEAGAYKPEDLMKAVDVLQKAVKDLTTRVEALEKGSKTLSDALPVSIAEVIETSIKALKDEVAKDYEKAVSSTKDVKDQLVKALEKDEALEERVKSIESIVPGRKANPSEGSSDSPWQGVFPF